MPILPPQSPAITDETERRIVGKWLLFLDQYHAYADNDTSDPDRFSWQGVLTDMLGEVRLSIERYDAEMKARLVQQRSSRLDGIEIRARGARQINHDDLEFLLALVKNPAVRELALKNAQETD